MAQRADASGTRLACSVSRQESNWRLTMMMLEKLLGTVFVVGCAVLAVGFYGV
ncbi:MAG: hypothetical protein KDK91_21400 [Gammaproteobacteria bacterium]|nr:hypothetical protein [Gammaproteobacteria bacterium]